MVELDLSLFEILEKEFSLDRKVENSPFYESRNHSKRLTFDSYEKKLTYFDDDNDISIRITSSGVDFNLNPENIEDYEKFFSGTRMGKELFNLIKEQVIEHYANVQLASKPKDVQILNLTPQKNYVYCGFYFMDLKNYKSLKDIVKVVQAFYEAAE